MTVWVAAVKALLTAKGPGRELVVRVPGLAHCEANGLDVGEWCRLGIVDVLIAENSDGASPGTQTQHTTPAVSYELVS